MDLTPLSYDAELSCLSESSTSLAGEKKKFAIFGSQRTTTLDQSLISVYRRQWLTTQLVSILSFSTQVFFFSTRLAYFFQLKFKISTSVCSHNICLGFFSIHEHIFCKSKLIFFYCIQCLLQVSTYINYYVFDMFFFHRYNFVDNRMP